jgi:hypothetical protein
VSEHGKKVSPQTSVSISEQLFPAFDYYLNEADPDIVSLHRQDDSFVAAFSASDATRDGIGEASKDDYRELIRTNLSSLRRESEEHRSA